MAKVLVFSGQAATFRRYLCFFVRVGYSIATAEVGLQLPKKDQVGYDDNQLRWEETMRSIWFAGGVRGKLTWLLGKSA